MTTRTPVSLDVIVATFTECVADLREHVRGRNAAQVALWIKHLDEDLKSLRLLAMTEDEQALG